MKRMTAVLLTGFLCFSVYSQVDTSKSKFWMMTYFINGSTTDFVGPRLAFSSDTTGTKWQKYNNEAALFTPIQVTGANDHRCRDPMIAYDAVNDSFHMVWTVSWTGTCIGYASSKNLKTWSSQYGLPVGTNITNCSVCWAPEIFWDDIRSQWMVYWSSNQSGGDKHIYFVLTNNIRSLTTAPTPTRLFNLSPDYTVIDADIFKYAAGSYYMFFKDERDGTANKDVHYVTGSTPQGNTVGSWSAVHAKVANTGTEGPCLVKQGGEYHCFFDPYGTTVTYRMTRTTDINTSTSPWTDAGTLVHWTGTSNASFTYSHGNVIEIPKKYVLWMLYNIPLPVVGVKFMPTLAPKSSMNGVGDIKLFNLSGRMISIERIGRGEILGASYGRLPAGFYIRTAGSMKNKVAKVTK